MSKNRRFAIALIVPLVFTAGCASAGMKKPTVFVGQYNNIPADIPSQFPNRYERHISGKELKEFNKLQTDEERQVFIDKFWFERDTNPSTPENERKQEIDGYIDDIANERFLNTSGVFRFSFRTNGGFRGDMAQIYLLHGKPNAMDMIESQSQLFVPLMLWIYGNPENGRILYAFLFYQKGSGGAFKLFSQDLYQMDQCGAINEIKTFREVNLDRGNQGCPPDVDEVFRELQTSSGKGGSLDGYIFAWALFNFSQDGSVTQRKALEPPKPASEIAKQSKAHVAGEAPKLIGTAGTDYILSSCPVCNSLIPAELRLGKEFALSVRRSDVDWRVVGDQADVELKVRIVFESKGRKPLVFEDTVVFKDKKELVVSDPAGRVSIFLLNVDSIPAGTYRVSVYVKNLLAGSNKYNAWDEEFTKP